MEATAIIPVFNNEDTIGECISSLKKQSVPFKEILVVDDGSRDMTVEIAKKAGVRVIQIPRAGRSGARNHGAKKAGAEIIMFIESDSVYSRNWLKEVLARFEEGADAVIDRRAVLRPKSFVARMNDAIFTARYQTYEPFSAWAFKRSIFLKLSGFDKKLEYGEDVDLGDRLLAAGYSIACAQKAFQWHAGEPRSLREGIERSITFGRRMGGYYEKHPEKFPTRKIAAFTLLPFTLFFPPLFLVLVLAMYLHVFFKFLPRKISLKYVAAYPFYVIVTEFFFTLGYWLARFGFEK